VAVDVPEGRREEIAAALAAAERVDDRQRLLRSGVQALVGLVAADPGSKSLGSLVTSLVAGRTYALICNIVDPPGKPSHMAQGMFRVVIAR
jgi:hypothetical protein